MYSKKKDFNEILIEQIDRFVDNLDLKNGKKAKVTLNELFSINSTDLVKSIGGQDIETDSEIDNNLWEWFLQTINQSMQESSKEWIELLKEQKLKILCYKYFTKKDLIDKKQLEKELKIKIRKYFTALQNYSDLEGFREKITGLPSELLSNLIRYILLVAPELNSKIKVSKKEFKDRVIELMNERMKMIENVSLISKSYNNILDISLLKKLYDNGVFFEDNILNRGVNEYIVKLLNHKSSSIKIKDNFSNTFSFDLKLQASTSSAYVEHLSGIKKGESQEFFTFKGMQVGNRFYNEIELVKEKKFDEDVIDNKSVFKEPKAHIKSVVSPWETTTNEPLEDTEGGSSTEGGSFGGSSGGSSSGGSFGGGGSFGNEFNSDQPLAGEDEPSGEGGESGQTTEGGENEGEIEPETPLPTDKQGFPVDFGTEETNPQAVEKTKEQK